MKIGILTYHYVCNFGAQLQALSTFSYFLKKGYEVKIIDWEPNGITSGYSASTLKKQISEHRNFTKNFRLTKICKTNDDVANVISEENFDAVIIGSDAVIQYCSILSSLKPSRNLKLRWFNLKEADKFPNPFFGLHPNKKRTKYFYLSVSAQNCNFNNLLPLEKRIIYKFVRQFTWITVRDTWTQSFFRTISKGQILPPITPDPVFNFNENCKSLILETESKIAEKFSFFSSKYLLVSFKKQFSPKTKNWVKTLESIAKQQGITVVSLPYPQESNTFGLSTHIDLPLSPIDWYLLIKHSAGYIGNNMHPIVSSIHNCTPFFVFDQYVLKKNFLEKTSDNFASSKIYDLLNNLSLTEYYYNIKSSTPEPSPEYVLNKILSFNTKKTLLASRSMSLRYQITMQHIEDFIQQ